MLTLDIEKIIRWSKPVFAVNNSSPGKDNEVETVAGRVTSVVQSGGISERVPPIGTPQTSLISGYNIAILLSQSQFQLKDHKIKRSIKGVCKRTASHKW